MAHVPHTILCNCFLCLCDAFKSGQIWKLIINDREHEVTIIYEKRGDCEITVDFSVTLDDLEYTLCTIIGQTSCIDRWGLICDEKCITRGYGIRCDIAKWTFVIQEHIF